jgi:geranylgeranyl diphosphate synthase type II
VAIEHSNNEVDAQRERHDSPGFAVLERYCAGARAATLDEIGRMVGAHGSEPELYRLMLDYPLRPGKALRPALCLATCRALGGAEESVVRTAAVIELLHNAFLIHDDVEDESLYRRGERTLQRLQGLPVAVNVADGMFALALRPLLENTELLGLGPALEILGEVADMVRVTVEGQATELGWIRDNISRVPGGDYRTAYEDMVARKTGRYSFVTPVVVGTIAAAVDGEARRSLREYAGHLGIAFQIADDLLNLRDDAVGYGKERAGDLWEGKRTLMLLHALEAEGDSRDGRRAVEALRRPRPAAERAPGSWPSDPCAALRDAVERLHRRGGVDEAGRCELLEVIARVTSEAAPTRTEEDVELLEGLIGRHDGVAHAQAVALEHVEAARAALAQTRARLAPGEARDFLEALPPFVVERLR